MDVFTLLLPYISTSSVSGIITAQATGEATSGELSLRLIDGPFDEPLAAVSIDSTGRFSLLLPPGDYVRDLG